MLKRILVLDNDPAILDVLKEALSYESFDVKITSDYSNLINEVRLYHPDLVICDYNSHGPKGDEICVQLKRNTSLTGIPVIICSAYINKNEKPGCDCDAFIAKPFGLMELMEKVNGLVYCD
jgi:DNA-binding response OmpR family regulator